MATHRCAVCGSANVVTDTQSAGLSYNTTKGAIGNAVLGAGGAFLGFENKTQQVYICQDCGITLTYCMPEDLKTAIDLCLVNKELRAKLTLQGYPINWNYIRNTYKNIEEGSADRISAKKEKLDSENLLSYATATVEEFEEAIEIIIDFMKSIKGKYNDETPMTLEEYYIWQNAVAVFIENAAKYYESNPKYHYVSSGITEMNLSRLFMVYLFEKIRVESGYYPEFIKENQYGSTCEDFEHYAKKHPFVLLFADRFFKAKKMEPFTHVESDYSWTPKMFGRIFANHYYEPGDEEYPDEDTFNKYGNLSSSMNSNQWNGFWFIAVLYEELDMAHFTPRYIVQNGKLYYTQYTHARKPRQYFNIENLSEFFKTYPYKEEIYKGRLEKIEKLKEKIKANEEEKERLNKQVDDADEKVLSMKAEVTKLSKKIFGKQKAQVRIEELNKGIETILEAKNAVITRIEEIEKENQKSSPEEEYSYLVSNMDHFLILHPCEP